MPTTSPRGDSNGQLDVFRHDRDVDQDGVFDEPGGIATQLVSTNTSGIVGDALSIAPRISADGSVVAFNSEASNLLTAPDHDTNGTFDVYATTFDTTGALTQVRIISRPASGAPTGLPSFQVDMNAAGDAFAFVTDDVGILPGDTNGNRDVVVVNTRTGTIRRGTGSVQGDREQNFPSISDDGNIVAYVSGSTNLAPGDVRDTALDVFVTNLVTGVTTVESRAPSGIEDDGTGSFPKLSGDASRVAFISGAIGFIPGDTGGITRLYVRDRLAGRTQVVSTDGALTPNGGFGTMSENGRYVTYFDGSTSVFVRAALVPAIDSVFAIDPNTQAEVAAVLHPGINKLRVHGAAIGPDVRVLLGAGLSVSVAAVQPGRIDLDVTVAASAAVGPRDLVVNNAGGPAVGDLGAFSSCHACVTVGP
jgi:Tol biopolymer transport system component